MMREGSKQRFYDYDKEVVVFRKVDREMIEELEIRLEALKSTTDFNRGSKSGMLGMEPSTAKSPSSYPQD